MKQGIVVGQLIVNNATDEQFNLYPNLDAKYGPYDDIGQALSALSKPTRAVGLTVGIRKEGNAIEEYWFKGGIENKHLVLKQLSADLSDYYNKKEVDDKFVDVDDKFKEVDNTIENTNKEVSDLRDEVINKTVEAVIAQDTPPTNKDALWIDTSGKEAGIVGNDDLASVIEAIQSIQNYLDTIVRQRDLIITPGHVSNTVTSTLLSKYEPIDPSVAPSEKMNIVLRNVNHIANSLEPTAEGFEPTTKAVCGHYGTLAEIQANFQKFVEYELLLAIDVKRLYTKINGEPVNLTGSGGSGGGGSIDYEALDKLDTIGLIAPSGQIYRVKVNNNGQLVVYKKELDTDQAEPTGGQEDPNTGWIYVTSLYLQNYI